MKRLKAIPESFVFNIYNLACDLKRETNLTLNTTQLSLNQLNSLKENNCIRLFEATNSCSQHGLILNQSIS